MSARGAYFINPQSGFNGIPPFGGAVSPDGITLDLLGAGGTLEIKSGGVSNNQVSATAAIALTKMATTPLSILGQVSNFLTAVYNTTTTYTSIGIPIVPIAGKIAIIIGKISLNMEATGLIGFNAKLVSTLAGVYGANAVASLIENTAAITVNEETIDIPVLSIYLNPDGVKTIDLQVNSSVASQFRILSSASVGAGLTPTYISAITFG